MLLMQYFEFMTFEQINHIAYRRCVYICACMNARTDTRVHTRTHTHKQCTT